jgi:hypothetical protein
MGEGFGMDRMDCVGVRGVRGVLVCTTGQQCGEDVCLRTQNLLEFINIVAL